MRKIGPHIMAGTAAALGRPPLLKAVNPSVEYVHQLRAQAGPDCLIVIRWTESAQHLDNPQARANAWLNRRQAQMQAMAELA